MNVHRVIYVSIAVLALAGCKEKEKALEPGDLPPETVVVKVDDTVLTFATMDARAMGYLRYAQEHQGLFFATNLLPQAKEKYRKDAINTFVYTTLLLNEAARQGITLSEQEHTVGLQKFAYSLLRNRSNTNIYFNNGPHPPDVMRRNFHDSLLIEKLIVKKKEITVMTEDVDKMMAEIEEMNTARRATLQAAHQQILGGASFEDVAREVSEDTASAKNGGDLGEFARGKYDPAIEEAAFRTPPGQVGEVVESKAGFHLIKVMAKNPAQAAKDDAPAVPETVRAAHIFVAAYRFEQSQIAEMIYRRKFIANGRVIFDELKAQAKIENTMFPDMEYKPLDSSK